MWRGWVRWGIRVPDMWGQLTLPGTRTLHQLKQSGLAAWTRNNLCNDLLLCFHWQFTSVLQLSCYSFSLERAAVLARTWPQRCKCTWSGEGGARLQLHAFNHA